MQRDFAFRYVRLFLSSTFRDWRCERERLRRGLFCELAEDCKRKGLVFLPVDLRWGVTEADQRRGDTVAVCLDEVRHCKRLTPRPRFLLFLGGRYGWRPAPAELSGALRRKLEELGVWERVAHWYRRDENACEELHVLVNSETGENEVRSALDDAYRADSERWERTLSRRDLALLVGSVTELEAHAAIENESEACEGRVFVIERVVDRVADEDREACEEQDDVGRRMLRGFREWLKRHVPQDQWWEWKAGELRLCDRCRDERRVFKDRCGERTDWDALERWLRDGLLGAMDEAKAEVEQARECLDAVEISASSLTPKVVGYETEREELRSAAGPTLLFGAAGMGKSTLLAEACDHWRQDGLWVADAWVGREAGCARGEGVLRHWLRMLRNHEPLSELIPAELAGKPFGELLGILEAALRDAPEEARRRVRLVVDGLDQLPAGDPLRDNWSWMRLGAVAVASTLDEELKAAFSPAVKDGQVIELEGLKWNDGEQALQAHLARHGRQLANTAQRRVVLAAFAAGGGNPLHLRLLAERARGWRSFDVLSDELPRSMDEAIRKLFEEWASHFGEAFVKRVCALLAASRLGLAEHELWGELLRGDKDLVEEYHAIAPYSPKLDKLPEVLWSRLRRAMEGYLARREVQGEELLDFLHPAFHREAAAWVGSELLARARQDVARMFLNAWEDEEQAKPRVLEELAPALDVAGMAKELAALGRDARFLRAQEEQDLDWMLETLRRAAAALGASGDAVGLAEFALRHGEAMDRLRAASPLEALRAGDWNRALDLIARQDEPRQPAWLLVCALDRAQSGDWLAVETLLARLRDLQEKIARTNQWEATEIEASALLMKAAFENDRNMAWMQQNLKEALPQRTWDQAVDRIVRQLARKGGKKRGTASLDCAVDLARQIEDDFLRGYVQAYFSLAYAETSEWEQATAMAEMSAESVRESSCDLECDYKSKGQRLIDPLKEAALVCIKAGEKSRAKAILDQAIRLEALKPKPAVHPFGFEQMPSVLEEIRSAIDDGKIPADWSKKPEQHHAAVGDMDLAGLIQNLESESGRSAKGRTRALVEIAQCCQKETAYSILVRSILKIAYENAKSVERANERSSLLKDIARVCVDAGEQSCARKLDKISQYTDDGSNGREGFEDFYSIGEDLPDGTVSYEEPAPECPEDELVCLGSLAREHARLGAADKAKKALSEYLPLAEAFWEHDRRTYNLADAVWACVAIGKSDWAKTLTRLVEEALNEHGEALAAMVDSALHKNDESTVAWAMHAIRSDSEASITANAAIRAPLKLDGATRAVIENELNAYSRSQDFALMLCARLVRGQPGDAPAIARLALG